MSEKTLWKAFLHKKTFRFALIFNVSQWAVVITATALNSIIMIIQKLPYILFRSYPNFGYLTDNRNFGYDTALHSSLKVGELLLSNTGSTFYASLKSIPEDIGNVIYRLCKLFPNVPSSVIKNDALEFFKDLYSRGFVFLGNIDEYSEYIYHYFSYDKKHFFELDIPQQQISSTVYKETFGKVHALSRIHIDVSSRCNERCIHCYIPNENKCNIMTEKVFDNVLMQCRNMNVLNLTISGGEPMLNPNLKSFLLKCIKNNFSVNLLSNLTLLSSDLLDIIASNPLVCVQTSLYSMDEKVHDAITKCKGSFQKTMQAIALLHKRDVPLQINCPIMKQNINSYKSVLEFANSMNIEADSDYSLFGSYDLSCSNLECRLSAEEIEKIENTKNLKETEIEYIRSKRTSSSDSICPVCKSSLCVSNIGDVYPCEGWQSLILGNIEKQSLKEIWENNPLVLRLRGLTYKDFPKCNSCKCKQYCSMCLIMNANEDLNGNYKNINTFMCDIAKIKSQRKYI